MIEPKPFRIYRRKTSDLWIIQKYNINTNRYKRIGEAPFALSKNNSYIFTKPPSVASESLLGFADMNSVESFTKISMKQQLSIGAEIRYPEFTWDEGGSVGYTDVNFYSDEGRIYNIIPVPIEEEE